MDSFSGTGANVPAPNFNSPSRQSAAPPAAAKAPVKGKPSRKDAKKKGPEGDDKPVTRKLVTRQRATFGIFALLAAAILVLVLTQEEAKTYVVRTSASIGQFATITPNQLEAVAIDPTAVESGAFSGEDAEKILDEAVDAIGDGRLQYPLTKGQQLHLDAFTTEATLPDGLAADERLISISAVAATSVSGNIRSGDRVDIIAVNNNGSTTASVLKTNVPVESVSLSGEQLDTISSEQADPESESYDKTVSEIVPAALIPGSYVVRVSTADVLNFAVVDGDPDTTLYLIYRGGDAVDLEGQTPRFVEEALGFDLGALTNEAPVE